MNFELTDDLRAIQAAATEFSHNELLPNAARWDEEKHFPVTELRHAAALGFAGIYVRSDVGGSDLGRAGAALIFEALAYGCISTAAYLSVQNMCAWVVDTYASDTLRKSYLPRMASMDLFASYCLTEPGSGSDAASLRTTARRDRDSYVLSGSKAFISGAGAADVYIVMARTGEPGPRGISAFLVEKGTPGLSFGVPERKMGWNAQPTAAVHLDECRVPVGQLIGKEGEGFRIAMSALDGGRVNIGACSLGGGSRALDVAKEYMLTRRQFERPLKDFQALQFKLADMATNLDAARLMVYRAAHALDSKSTDAAKFGAMAKRFATDAGYQIADEALQLHGGYGYLKDFPLERIVRDLRVNRILEGTNEIMRVVIARELFRQ
jgi:hypothetical protein